MRIIHCADLHLDSKMESNLDREQALLRRSELIETYERMVDYAHENQVRAILISGDLFDKTHIRKEVKKRVDILYRVYRKHGMSRFYYFHRWAMELAKYLLG